MDMTPSFNLERITVPGRNKISTRTKKTDIMQISLHLMNIHWKEHEDSLQSENHIKQNILAPVYILWLNMIQLILGSINVYLFI